MGTREVEFDADVYGGNVNGSVGEGAESRRVVLEGEALDLSRVPLEGEDWNIDATGLARIAADLTLDAEDTKASEGTFNLAIDDLAIVSAKAMGIDLTPASSPKQSSTSSWRRARPRSSRAVHFRPHLCRDGRASPCPSGSGTGGA